MEKEFKNLRGHRVYLEMPQPEKESKLIVDDNTKESLQKEMLQKMNKLVVYGVGELITDLKEGDIVLVEPTALSKALMIPLSDSKTVLLVSTFDIIHTWN